MAYERPLTIIDVISDIEKNKYVLPSIQREYVWNTAQIENLFDSIMKEYPIGTFLFWELKNDQNIMYDYYTFLRDYHEKNSTKNSRINLIGNSNVMAVLDGQQRLNSLYIGLKGSYAYKTPRKQWKNEDAFPKRELYLNIISYKKDSHDYDFKFLSSDEVKNNSSAYWFKVSDILKYTNIGDIMLFIGENVQPVVTGEQYMFASRTLSLLYDVIMKRDIISYYKIQSDDLDMVLNIFIRINSGGTVLSYSDLLLSIATAQWEKLDAREEIIDCVDTINRIGKGFNVNKDFVLKSALILSDIGEIAFKVNNFNKSNMLLIENNWQIIKTSLYQAFKLVSDFGFDSENLKSNNAVIPIAYYLKMIGNPITFCDSSSTLFDRKNIKRWLTLALLKRNFSGTSDNVLRQLRNILLKNGTNDFPIEAILEKSKGSSKTLLFTEDDIESLLDHQYGNGETLTILMLLYPSLDFSNKFHIDHMYPKSKFTQRILKEKGIEGDKQAYCLAHYNDLSNLQLLSAIPNMEKQDKDFDAWFNSINLTEDDKRYYREIHYLPDMEYTYENFENFLNERRELLKQKLMEILL